MSRVIERASRPFSRRNFKYEWCRTCWSKGSLRSPTMYFARCISFTTLENTGLTTTAPRSPWAVIGLGERRRFPLIGRLSEVCCVLHMELAAWSRQRKSSIWLNVVAPFPCLSSLEFPCSTSYYGKPGGVDTESKHTLTLKLRKWKSCYVKCFV